MDFDLLLQAGVLAYVLMQLTDAILKPINEVIGLVLHSWTLPTADAQEVRATAIRRLIDLWPLYTTGIVAGGLAWFSGMNVFSLWFPAPLGQVLTSIAIGLGPSFVHDLKPKESKVLVAFDGEVRDAKCDS